MFGKTRDLNDNGSIEAMTIEDFFGDEISRRRGRRDRRCSTQRVVQAESQINSQFTSLATYAQIAQEQIELARAEAKASTERSEHRVTELIERERADRISADERRCPDRIEPRRDRPPRCARAQRRPDQGHTRRVLRPAARVGRSDQPPLRPRPGIAGRTSRTCGRAASLEAIELESADEMVQLYGPATAQPHAIPGALPMGPIPGLSLRLDVTAA